MTGFPAIATYPGPLSVAIHQKRGEDGTMEVVTHSDDPSSAHRRLLAWIDEALRFIATDAAHMTRPDHDDENAWIDTSSSKENPCGLLHRVEVPSRIVFQGTLAHHGFANLVYVQPIGRTYRSLMPDRTTTRLAVEAATRFLVSMRGHVEAMAHQSVHGVPGPDFSTLRQHASDVATWLVAAEATATSETSFIAQLPTPWTGLHAERFPKADDRSALASQRKIDWRTMPALVSTLTFSRDADPAQQNLGLELGCVLRRAFSTPSRQLDPIETMRATRRLDAWPGHTADAPSAAAETPLMQAAG